MPVDDDNIETLLSKARIKEDEIRTQRYAMRKFMENLNGIRMIDAPDPTEAEPNKTKKEMPKDKVLNSTLTDTRRQTIYDQCVADAITLGI